MLIDLKLEVQKLVRLADNYNPKSCCQRGRLKRTLNRARSALLKEMRNKNTGYSEAELLRIEVLLREMQEEFRLG
jgi:hypothetical protein